MSATRTNKASAKKEQPKKKDAKRPRKDAARPEPTTKIMTLVTLMRRPGGARLDELMAASGWQAHSVRGAISGTMKKKLKLTVTSERAEAGRIYRLAP